MLRRAFVVIAAFSLVGALSALPAVAATSTDVQANDPQVANDPGSDASAVFPTNKQNEPSIAVDPTDPTHLIAGSNDEQLQPPCGPGPVRGLDAEPSDCSFFPNVGTDGVYTSSDGGASWTNRGLLPGFSDDGGPLVSDGDPVIVFGPKPDGDGGFSFDDGARAYYAGLASYATGAASGNQEPELLTVSHSDDQGITWSDPVIGALSHGFVFNDKESLWADRNPDSPFFGRLYLTWTQFRDLPGCAEPVRTSYSDDGGMTWSRQVQLSPAQNCGLGGRQGTVVRTGPDGTVYVVWEDSDVRGFKQVVAVSRNGGVSYSRPRLISYQTDIDDPIPGSNFRTDSFASLGVDQSSGAVYAAWSDAESGEGTIVVARGTNHGRSWTDPVAVSGGADEGYAFFQGLDVAPNGRIDVGYQALTAVDGETFGTGNASIDAWYTSSSNGGATWSTPVKVSSASSDPAVSSQNNLERQFWGDYNTLVSTNDAAWFIYTDSRTGAGCEAVDDYQLSIVAEDPIDKPAPPDECPSQFGNTDAWVSIITP